MQAFIDCGAELALGHHYGTFQLTDEPFDAPLAALADALKAAGIPPERFRALRAGEVVTGATGYGDPVPRYLTST